jgi:hypothetical protein
MDDSTRSPLAVTAGTVSAVSWAAILAGAAVAVAASLAVFALVTGLDLTMMNPARASVGGQVAFAAIGLIATQWVSACLGGYVTGRLRTRWTGTHTHEVFFRDTAHGLIAWCVATIVVASGIAAGATSAHNRMLGRTVYEPAGAAVAAESGYAADANRNGTIWEPVVEPRMAMGQLVIPPAALASAGAPDDAAFLSAPVSAFISAAAGAYDGRARLRAADVQPEEESEPLRRDAGITSILTSLSMLIGAFIACVSAALGGRLRDEHP